MASATKLATIKRPLTFRDVPYRAHNSFSSFMSFLRSMYYALLLFGCLLHPSVSLVKEVDSAILVGNGLLCKTTMSVPGSRNLHKAKLLVSANTRITDDPHQRTHQKTHQSLAPGTDSGPLVYSEYSFIWGRTARGSRVETPRPPSPRSVPGKGP